MVFFSRLASKFELLIQRVFPLFSFFIPKKKNRWVFGAWDGKVYSDNSKYLFEYIVKNHPEIDAIWIARSKDIKKQLNMKGFKCFTRFSLQGIASALSANVALVTSCETADISPFVNRKCTETFQLWHGMGPKRVRWKKKNGELWNSGKRLRRFSEYYWMAPSKIYIDLISEFYAVPKSRFILTGYPRNDALYFQERSERMEDLKKAHPGCKFIIYVPTHRNFGVESIDIHSFNMIDDFFRKNNIVMVYKPHFHELKNILHLEKSFTNIILAKDPAIWGDPYSYIYYFDLMICDYSSLAYDFLCTGKPIVLYTYDLEHYKNLDAGLSDFFEELPLGPFCMTWEETLQNVLQLLQNDTWKEQREKCRPIFHVFNDGKNCERVYNTVNELLANKKR